MSKDLIDGLECNYTRWTQNELHVYHRNYTPPIYSIERLIKSILYLGLIKVYVTDTRP